MLPAKGNVTALAAVPKQLCPHSDVLPRGTASPKAPFVSVTQQLHSGGWVWGLGFIFLMADEVPSEGEALPALSHRFLCSCTADKTFGHSITAGVAGRV